MAAELTQLHQAQIAAILGPDPTQFETLVFHLKSTNNEQHSQAEALFNLCKQHHPDDLSVKLAQLLQSSPHTADRAMAAILLRKQLTRDDSYLWPQLNPSTQSTVKSVLLACIQRENSKTILKKLCDTVSDLAAGISPDNGWPELLPSLFEGVISDNLKLRVAALLIFAQLAQYIGDTLIPHLDTLHNVFFQCLSGGSSADVRIAALGAAVNFIQCLNSASDRDRFQDLLPLMMRTLTQALEYGQEPTAQEALELLTDLAGTEPKFFKYELVEVVGSILEIAEAESFQEGTRHLAIEFIITLAESSRDDEEVADTLSELPQFSHRLYSTLMKMLLDIEDDPTWHSADWEHMDAGETSNYRMAQESLDRLAKSVCGSPISHVSSEILRAYLDAPEWQKPHAAMISIAQITEGCAKMMLMGHTSSMVFKAFQHSHPRVRWAAVNAIGQLCTDFGPDLLTTFHNVIIPALTAALDDFQNPRLQAHAASAVQNFSETCTAEVLSTYMDDIVSKLHVLLQHEKQMVQEGALTALGSVADSSKEQFQQHYDAVMPDLKAILVNTTGKSCRMLFAKSMECISLVGLAVGKEKFGDDAKQVMEVFMSLQGFQMVASDPTTSHISKALASACKCLGQDFLPYMSVVMNPMLQSAQLKPDETITLADSDAQIDESGDESIKTLALGDKRTGIKTSLFEEKTIACNTLCCYADELKEAFFPWIDQVASTLVPLLKFYFHEEVRRAAVSAMPKLLRSAKLAIENGQAQGHNESYLKQLSDYIIPALVEALHKEPETKICSNMLESLGECIQISGLLLDESQVKGILDEIKHLLMASSSRKREREERAKDEDFDAEDELFKEENEKEEALFDKIDNCSTTLITTCRAIIAPLFEELSTYLTPMWGKEMMARERRVAIRMVCDILGQCGEAALKYYDTYLYRLLDASSDENPDVRLAGAYGVGVCAEFGGSVFSPVVGDALSRLDAIIRHPNATDPENMIEYDTAVGALDKICQHHRDSIDAAQVVKVLMSLQASQMEIDDQKVSHMLRPWAKTCKCLGPDFLPHMSVVMPSLLQSAQLKPDETITLADSDAEVDKSGDESIETVTLGDKRIAIKTSVLKEKATACNMLCCYADELKEGFFPWIDQGASTLVPFLKFYFHEEVRKAAVSAMPKLLHSAKLAIENGQAQGHNESYLKQLSDYIIPALVEALHKEPETKICSNMLGALSECIEISGPLLDESHVRSIVDEIKQVLTASSSRRKEREERMYTEDFDEEEEPFKEGNQQEDELLDRIDNCLSNLIKTFKASFFPFFDELSTYLTPMWGNDKTPRERNFAICIFDSIVEQCGEAALKYFDPYLYQLLNASNDEQPDVQQAAAYGLGLCAEFGGSAFTPVVGDALPLLIDMTSHPNSKNYENLYAYDNAVSAICKIILFHRDSIDAAQVVPLWLNCLPIRDDVAEAKYVHEQLCSMVERSDGDLLGPNNENLPKIVAVLAEAIIIEELATEEAANRMIKYLKHLQQTLSPSDLASAWSSLTPQQQIDLPPMLSD
ncbi:Importin-5 [Ancistrocladus abbreviatus]